MQKLIRSSLSMRFHKILSLILIAISHLAEGNEMCQVLPIKERITPITCKQFHSRTKKAAYPTWWSRPDPCESDSYYYSCDDLENVRLNLRTGKQELVPGRRDAVPLPDCKLLSVSGNMDENGDKAGIRFFEPDVVSTEKKAMYHLDDTPPLLEDKSMIHAYQSMATLSNQGNNTTYRVLIDDDQGGVVFKDYRVKYNGKTPTFDPSDVSKQPSPICTQVTLKGADGKPGELRKTGVEAVPADFKIKLPILSKDGTMLSAFDPVDQVTRIYKVDLANPTRCQELVNLGIPTGKPEFSYDNNKIVFHSNSKPGIDSWFRYEGRDVESWDSSQWNNTVFTVDLKSGQMRQISKRNPNNPLHGSSYYPAFRKDGSVVFMRANSKFVKNEEKDREYLEPQFEAVTVSAEDVNEGPLIQSERAMLDCSDSSDRAALVALGLLWKDACTHRRKGEITEASDDAGLALTGLGLDPKICRQQVARLWNDQANRERLVDVQEAARQTGSRLLGKDDYAKLTMEDLEAACP